MNGRVDLEFRYHEQPSASYFAVALVLVADEAGANGGTRAWSILHVCLFANASETFFLRRISSRSGEERSGRKGTNIGALALFFTGEVR